MSRYDRLALHPQARSLAGASLVSSNAAAPADQRTSAAGGLSIRTRLADMKAAAEAERQALAAQQASRAQQLRYEPRRPVQQPVAALPTNPDLDRLRRIERSLAAASASNGGDAANNHVSDASSSLGPAREQLPKSSRPSSGASSRSSSSSLSAFDAAPFITQPKPQAAAVSVSAPPADSAERAKKRSSSKGGSTSGISSVSAVDSNSEFSTSARARASSESTPASARANSSVPQASTVSLNRDAEPTLQGAPSTATASNLLFGARATGAGSVGAEPRNRPTSAKSIDGSGSRADRADIARIDKAAARASSSEVKRTTKPDARAGDENNHNLDLTSAQAARSSGQQRERKRAADPAPIDRTDTTSNGTTIAQGSGNSAAPLPLSSVSLAGYSTHVVVSDSLFPLAGPSTTLRAFLQKFTVDQLALLPATSFAALHPQNSLAQAVKASHRVC